MKKVILRKSSSTARPGLRGDALIQFHLPSQKDQVAVMDALRHKVRGVLLDGTHPRVGQQPHYAVEGLFEVGDGSVTTLSRQVSKKVAYRKGGDRLLKMLPRGRQERDRLVQALALAILKDMAEANVIRYNARKGAWTITHAVRMEHVAAKTRFLESPPIRRQSNKQYPVRRPQGRVNKAAPQQADQRLRNAS